MKKTLLTLALFSSFSFAEKLPDIEQLSQNIGLKINSIEKSPIENLYQISTNRGVLYTNQDGQYIISGDMYDTQAKANLTENFRAKSRIENIEKIKDQAITYSSKNEKYIVTVFTDISCPYCHKLHEQIPEYNKLGITIQYLAFPRGGMDSKPAKDMQNIWCADDKIKAMNDGMAKNTVDAKSCQNPVEEQYKLGLSFRVQGTPAIILPNGNMIPGYQPPQNLIQILDSQTKD